MKNIYALLVLDLNSGLPVLNRSYMDDFENHDNVVLFSAAFSAIQSLLSEVKVGKVNFFSTYDYNVCISSNERYACVGIIPPPTIQTNTNNLLDEILSMFEDEVSGNQIVQYDNLTPFNQEIDEKIQEFNKDTSNAKQISDNYEMSFYQLRSNMGFIPYELEENEIDSKRKTIMTAWVNNIWNKISEKNIQEEKTFIDIVNNDFVVICSIRKIPDSQTGAILFSSDFTDFKDLVYSKHIFSVISDEIYQLIAKNLSISNTISINDRTQILKLITKFKNTFRIISGKEPKKISEILGIQELGSIYENLVPKITTSLITGHPLAIVGEKEFSIPIIRFFSSLNGIKDYSFMNFDFEFHRIVLLEDGNTELLKELGYKFLSLHSSFSDFEIEANKYLANKWNNLRNKPMITRLEDYNAELVYIWNQIFTIISNNNYSELSASYDKELNKLLLQMLHWINPVLYPLKQKKINKKKWW